MPWPCGINQPLVCRLSGLAGPRPALLPFGMTSGCVCPRCSGGGETLETELRFVRVRRAGPPFVLGGCAGSIALDGARERDRLRENSAPPFAETGDGVWRCPFGPPFGGCDRWKSDGPLMFGNEEMPDRLEICEEYEDGSPPANGLFPFPVVGEDGLFEGGS